ncbi:MAG: Ig-like domain-containing protein [Clostridiales bacterium]|nr:Ig-like domain-containing protein [Clostridiales bacterium]
MKQRQNETNDLLHCKNCDGYYDPSLPNCPRCGEETANNTMEGNGDHLTVDQYGGGYGQPGSAISRASLIIIIVLLLIALVTAIWLCVQALSQATPDTGATSSQVEEVDPADTSAQGDVSDSAASSSAPVQQEPEEEDETVEAETLTLDFYDLTLSEGEAYDLTATVSPAEWEGDFTWSSDDESVATVKQNGVVTYVGEGQCTVTVSAGGLTAQCVIRCNAPAQAEETQQTAEETTKTDEDEKEDETEAETTGSIVVEYTDITLSHVGDGYTCKPTGGNGTYTWSSADSSIATVSSSGYIVGVSKGNTTVTCTSGSETLTIIVRVAPD